MANRGIVVLACNLGGLAAIIQRERVTESYPGYREARGTGHERNANQ